MSLKTFKGGVHPHDFKELAKDQAIIDADVGGEVTVPMSQHIGAPAKVTVKVTDEVKRGQIIGESAGFVSANVHSPVSGKVKRIIECNTPVGTKCAAVLIENDGNDEWAADCNKEQDLSTLSAQQIKDRVSWAGLVGMGGATFPTHVKLSPPEDKKIDAVILNGVECEPYLTSDYRLMLESPEAIVEGLKLIMKVVGCSKGYIGIEDNKEDVFKVMAEKCKEMSSDGCDLKAELLEVKYPQGAEKQLIKAILDREVPSGGLPMDVGAVVQNVGTSHAVYEACKFNRPLTERIVTVTGDGVSEPKNFRARIGTPVQTLLDKCGFKSEANKLVYGGPMMGMAHFDTAMPVNKGMSGVLALCNAEIYEHRNCIRCGRCIGGCPQHLMPADLSLMVESGRFDDAKEGNLLDCIECGVCTYVCPARRPIVQWVKLAKYELNKQRLKEAAEK
ncbi:MAG: electron transport complex subunit RsxC [Planctomycetota bacterium]|jgi:electron transport complex protein RnfC